MLLERVTGRELEGSVQVQFLPEGLRATIRAGPSALAAQPERSNAAAPQGPRQELEARDGASEGVQEHGDISGLRVLVVEDAVLLALELEAALTEAGAHVLGPASSVEEALAMLDMDFDVALLDADLNGRSAAPLAKDLVARGRPYILASGQKDNGGAHDEAGVPMVRKPYNMRQITLALAMVTGRASGA
jgi:CheY-like chemotaxis protein